MRSLVRVSTEGGPFEGASAAVVRRRAGKMLDALELHGVELSVALVSDPVIHALNRDFRKKDRPTDVLAFAMREERPRSGAPAKSARRPGEREVLGDVIISLPTAARQARGRRRPLLDEVTMLLAHGLLHLLGWDHETAAKDRRMRAETARLCAAAAPPSSTTVRGAARSSVPGAVRSKGGADQALSRKRSAGRTPGRGRKNQ
jgi:probable rRNA maturation factor